LLAACETVQRRIGVRLDGLKPFALQHTAARERVRAILSSSVLDEALTAGSVATIDDTMVFVLNDDVVEPRAMGLTLREAHVARLVHSGLTSKEIAAQLSIRPRSVDQILYNAMRKLGVHSRHDIPL
jgi:DNA-binding CsgD family transcriptional regulator